MQSSPTRAPSPTWTPGCSVVRAPTTAAAPTYANGITSAVAWTCAVGWTNACGATPPTAGRGGLNSVETLANARYGFTTRSTVRPAGTSSAGSTTIALARL